MIEEPDTETPWAVRIRKGTSMSKDALEALKERFNVNAPVFIFDQNCASGVMPHQDAKMVTLNAAVRDGQREVLTYLEQVLNHD
jgi:hypothetical protein